MAWDVEVDASERAPDSLKPVDDLLCVAEGASLGDPHHLARKLPCHDKPWMAAQSADCSPEFLIQPTHQTTTVPAPYGWHNPIMRSLTAGGAPQTYHHDLKMGPRTLPPRLNPCKQMQRSTAQLLRQ